MIVTLCIVGVVAVVWAVACVVLSLRHPEPIWDWDTIDTSDIAFPENFLWGSATAAHQVDGGNTNNNWARWEDAVDEKGNPRIHNGDRAGAAAEHWQRYPEDIQRMKDELGLNS